MLVQRIDAACAAGSDLLDLSGADISEIGADVVEKLSPFRMINAANNDIAALPDSFATLVNLQTLFFLGCKFTSIPLCVRSMQTLSMLSFKSQRAGLESFADGCLPERLVWLILTDNSLHTLPTSLGTLQHLRKLMLASNCLSSLPDLSGCVSLELVRFADNSLDDASLGVTALPALALFTLPHLAWLALAGNPWGPAGKTVDDDIPGSATFPLPTHLRVDAASLVLGELLGTGASGNVHVAKHGGVASPAVAVKLFRGSSSDGRPVDEARVCLHLSRTPHVHVLHAHGWTWTDRAHAAAGAHVGMATLLPLHVGVQPLARPPSFETVTRDVYPPSSVLFPLQFIFHALLAVAKAMAHLHDNGVCHGDLYAHNILVDDPATFDYETGRILLSDFGAAFCYDRVEYGHAFERLEVKAFGCLTKELCDRLVDGVSESALAGTLRSMVSRCSEAVPNRPTFHELCELLESIQLTGSLMQ